MERNDGTSIIKVFTSFKFGWWRGTAFLWCLRRKEAGTEELLLFDDLAAALFLTDADIYLWGGRGGGDNSDGDGVDKFNG